MNILTVLKKHYLATILLLLSLGLLVYATGEKTNQKNQPVPSIQAENNSEDALRIPEIIKPTPVEKKEVESAGTVSPPTEIQPDTETPVDLIQGTFIINGQNYPVSFNADSTVYEVMNNLNTSGQLKVDFKDYSGLGYFVDGINGVKSDTFRAKYWIYYINGTKAQIGISNYQLKPKDIITWKYESAE